jgi:Ca2+-binding EF-hand superfamily protein
VIAYIVLSGKQPLKGATDQETFTNIAKGEISYADPIWESIAGEAQDFVKLLLTWDEKLRPTASEALNHPWMKNGQNQCTLLRQSTMDALNNLESFDAKSKLRVATCTFIASQLMGKGEKEKIDDAFRAIDLNNDGTLNKQEVKQGYNTYFGRELTDEEIDSIFMVRDSSGESAGLCLDVLFDLKVLCNQQHVDADGTGELEYSEFLFGALDKQNLLSSDNLKKAFSIFSDGNGDISLGAFSFVANIFDAYANYPSDFYGGAPATIDWTEELSALLGDALTNDKSVDEKALNKLIAQVDTDGDGKINYQVRRVASMWARSSFNNLPLFLKEFVNMALGTPFGETHDENEETSNNLKKLPKDESVKNEDQMMEPDTDGNGHELQNTLTLATQQANTSRSKRDPPTCHPGRGHRDPPSGQYSTFNSDGPPDQTPSSPIAVERLMNSQQPSYREPAASPAVRNLRISPRVKKLEEACEGFDRIQEKIVRLRMLLSSKEVVSKQPQTPLSAEQRMRSRVRSKGPNVETLDSAFTKLSQIQSKMRSLQALVKSNQL